jgi:hypothetical protein
LTVERRRFHVEAPWGPLAVVPTRHLTAAFGFRLAMLSALGGGVADALRLTPSPQAGQALHQSGPDGPSTGDPGHA